MPQKEIVCVTGAGGYLASWLIKLLLSMGYTVHGTVRDPDGDKNAHLKKLENSRECLKLFKADLMDYEGLYAAITGCTGVFHLASPVLPIDSITSPESYDYNAPEEVIEPAVAGTRNVLNACSKAQVKKVVVVSSLGAIVLNPDWPQDRAMDEESWSDIKFCDTNKQWYCLSKTRAEKEAWEYSKRGELNIVTICPSLVIGPLLQPTMNSSSLYLLKFLTDGNEQAYNGDSPFVDVRDTAEAILLVYKKPEAEGRYLCSSHVVRTQDLVEKLKKMYPHYNYPKSFAETGTTSNLSSKKLQDLGWTYRPFEETLVDAVKNFEERGDLVRIIGS